MRKNRLVVIYLVLALLLAVVILFRFGSYRFLDYLWYESQGQSGVWWALLSYRAAFYAIGLLLALLIYGANYAAIWLRTQRRSLSALGSSVPYYFVWGFLAFCLLVFHGPLFMQLWQSYVLASYGPEYGIKDPIHEIDASFYMFGLAWYKGFLGWLKLPLFISLAQAAALYLIPVAGQSWDRSNVQFRRAIALATPHLAMILGLLIAVLSLDAYLSRYSLIYSGTSAKVAGASYVDVHARSLAYTLFSYIGIVLALVVVVSGFLRNWMAPLTVLAGWILTYFVILRFYPSIIRLVSVNPNEFEAEKQYIEHSLSFTREAYGLGEVQRRNFPASRAISADILAANREIIDNIRLWDYRPVRSTLSQLQEIRQYYEFLDVDIDRYTVEGRPRQVMIAARELNKQSLPPRTRAWESRHLQYTHGYGLAMAPSNKVTPTGLPELWIRDFPPVITKSGLPAITRPEIYYGELTNDYVLVNTSLKEIDYPLEQSFAETVYEGEGGLVLGKGLRYLLLAWNFDTWKILLSRYVHAKSRILFRRNIHEAVRFLAPFLDYDSDPYIVLGKDGKLYWIMDAYTSSSRFPYSEKFEDHYLQTAVRSGRRDVFAFRSKNYIRNSIKVVIDAYNGKISFYLMDSKDPIALAWSKLFPELILPLAKMPPFLLSHLRYPENLFFIQAAIYTDYQMRDPRAFYNLEDRWQIATELYSGQTQAVEPYYTLSKLPGEKQEEYILMLPFIPNNKDNMIAWMAARCDYRSQAGQDNHYGKILLFDFPRTRQIYGPIQIESRIDQDPEISKDLTLWNQQGSRVIRGNLLVIPIEDTLLYIEPIYLQSTNSPFPELRRVIAADASSLVMGKDIEDALQLLASRSARSLDLLGTRKKLAEGLSDSSLKKEARLLLQQAQQALSRGSWLEFGRLMQDLDKLFQGP